MGHLIGYFLIFLARVADVSMATIRTIMVVRGRKVTAACIGLVEIVIYVLAISRVLGNMDNPYNLMAYALGFSTGNFVGITIEEKMAIGSLIVQVVTKNNANEELSQHLRDKGYGVTCTEGFGREGRIYVLNIVVDRKHLKDVENIVSEFDKSAFTTIQDVRNIRGGYFKRRIKKK